MRTTTIALIFASASLTGCASTGVDGQPCSGAQAISQPARCGSNYQRQSFAQAAPCITVVARAGVGHPNVIRVEHYRVSRRDYPPFMSARDKAELADLQQRDLDRCQFYNPYDKIAQLTNPVAPGHAWVVSGIAYIAHDTAEQMAKLSTSTEIK